MQTIQFSISMQFSPILTIDRALSGATIPVQSGPGSNGKEEVLRISQSPWSLTIRSFSVISRTLIGGGGGGGLTPLQGCSWCILLPQPTEQAILVEEEED